MTDITELMGNMGLDRKTQAKVIKALETDYKNLEHMAGTEHSDVADTLTSHGIDEEIVTDEFMERLMQKAEEIVIEKRDAEAEAKGIIKKRRAKVPFKERFRLGLLGGTKTCTTRPYVIGHPGDEFEAFGVVFEIVEVEELTLGQIAKKRYAAEGFENPEEFEKFWPQIHPHKKYDPHMTAFCHTFKLISITPPKGSEAIPPEPSKKEGKTPGQTTKKGDSASTSLINQAQKTLDMDWKARTEKVRARKMFMLIDWLEENPFNPNEMDAETDAALEEDAKEEGPEEIGELTVYPNPALDKPNRHTIINGAHRYRKAKKLKWTHAWVTIRYDVKSELDAMKLCWRINARHGYMDWFKESKMFSTMSKKGKSHKDIADMLHCKVPYVQDRISILVLGEENVLQAQKKGISLSALVQVAAIKDPVARQKALDKLLSGEVKTTEEVKEITTKKRTCPECGADAGSEKYVKCKKGHYFPVKAPKKEKKTDEEKAKAKDG